MLNYPPIVAILGPTAIGKSGLALQLAAEFDGEIVSADSRQIYRYLDIGTAKASIEERRRVQHHVVDVVDPDQPYSVARFLIDARIALHEIGRRSHVAFVVGGTGYYARTLLQGIELPKVPQAVDNLPKFNFGDALKTIEEVDPESAARLDKKNPVRVQRAWEQIVRVGGPVPRLTPRPTNALVLGISMDRPTHYAMADSRVNQQLHDGLVDETRRVLARGFGEHLPPLRGLAYKQCVDYLNGSCDIEQMRERYMFATHHLIRRQMTWFRREPRIHWLDAGSDNLLQSARISVGHYLRSRSGTG